MKNVPLILVWTSTNKDYGAMHAGSSYQNVGLFASAYKMGAVVRGYFDKEQVKQALKLNPNEYVLVSMAVGYPVFAETDDKEIPNDVQDPDLIETKPEEVAQPQPTLTPEASPSSIPPTPTSNETTTMPEPTPQVTSENSAVPESTPQTPPENNPNKPIQA